VNGRRGLMLRGRERRDVPGTGNIEEGHMKQLFSAGLLAVAMVASQAVVAEEATLEGAAAAAATQAATAAATQAAESVEAKTADNVVQLTPTGDQVVTVNSGNETVDKAANYAVKCGERMAAMKTCESLGSFKALACRKAAEFRYKGVECPIQ
jgi:hypothetical protein